MKTLLNVPVDKITAILVGDDWYGLAGEMTVNDAHGTVSFRDFEKQKTVHFRVSAVVGVAETPG